MSPTLTAALLVLSLATASAQTIELERVIDGDTIKLSIDGVSESLHIEGIDRHPGSAHPPLRCT